MICIFSTSVDASTAEVMRWLDSLGARNVLRVNDDDSDIVLSATSDCGSSDICFVVKDGPMVSLRDIKAVWYRKGQHWLCDSFHRVTIAQHAAFTDYARGKLQSEKRKLSEYIHFLIHRAVPALGSPTKSDLNKLIVLHAARSVGLSVPAFHISGDRARLKSLLSGPCDFVTKPMSDGMYFFDEAITRTGYFSYTEDANVGSVDCRPERISPSFVQEKIDKQFDVRVFFLDGTCYAMAILSQSDPQTRVDFRKYNYEKPNRTVPFKLPAEIETKLKALFAELDLNTGSVDLVVDYADKFHFLEINPVGQFGMVSRPCNYFLEKEIASTLREYATRGQKIDSAASRGPAPAAAVLPDHPARGHDSGAH
jgi:ATP-GRASP peptide maturase of grasp-with-spasm system